MRRQVLIAVTGRWHGTINSYAVASIAEIKFVTRKEQDRAFPSRVLVVSIWPLIRKATSALDHDMAQAPSIRHRAVCLRSPASLPGSRAGVFSSLTHAI